MTMTRRLDFEMGQGVTDPDGDLRYPHYIRVKMNRYTARRMIEQLIDQMYGYAGDEFWLHINGFLRERKEKQGKEDK